MSDDGSHRQWLENSPDATLVVNRSGLIQYANRAASEMLHYPPKVLLGQPIDKLVPEEVRAHHGSLVNLFFQSQGRHRMRNRIRVVANQGEMIDAEIQLAIVTSGGEDQAIVSIRDTSLLAETEKRLLKAELDYHHIFEVSSVPMCKVSLGGRFMKVNDRLCTLFGYKRDTLLDMTFQDITHADDLERDLELLHEVLEDQRRSYQMEKRYICADSRELWCNLTVSLIRDEMGFPDYFISVIQDISTKKAAARQLRDFNEKLQEMVRTDHLTQVNNRQALLDEMERQRSIFLRYQRPASILFIDLDNFKYINDTFSHACGDRALVEFASMMSDNLRDSDFIARYAGDEFIILLPETDQQEAASTADKLRQLNICFDYDNQTIKVDFSLGCASINEAPEGQVEAWIKLADERMYQDKERQL